MNFSLSLPSKSSSKSTPKSSQAFDDEDERQYDTGKQYVTEFDPSRTLTDPKKHQFIIPPKENEWQPAKLMKNFRDLPVIQSEDSRELKFEIESLSLDSCDGNISYGLNVRQPPKTGEASNMHESNGGDGDESGRHRSVESILLDKLRDDLKRLPEDRGFEEFVDMPVEGFGAALLAGYGWYEGRGIGKNAKGDVKVKQFKKWTSKEGLGYVAPSHGSLGA
ncbi:putative Protein MOS2 [Tripterygium wilfordii]|uniref:G-patch domain-containing protein n=1 Tax=Tripterygium wilfordii TaxID=458696 RepID=A0A7J7DQC9_TRIWF|nr:protein MOS2-like [Tripterygium wilfordii]KAF5748503.1 putative Protein MOS2 [Tripterygium wilfordii]